MWAGSGFNEEHMFYIVRSFSSSPGWVSAVLIFDMLSDMMPWLHWLTQYTICSSVCVLHCDLHKLTNHIMRWLTTTKTHSITMLICTFFCKYYLVFLCVYHSSTIVGAFTTVFFFFWICTKFFIFLFNLSIWMCQDDTMFCCICTMVIFDLFLICTIVVIWWLLFFIFLMYHC